MRDHLMSESYFDELIKFTEETAITRSTIKARSGIGKDPKFHAQYVFTIFKNHCELIFQRYTRGDAVDDLKGLFPVMVDAWEWAYQEEIKVFTESELENRKNFALNLDFYVLCMWIISIAVCLNIDDVLFKRIVLLSQNEGVDFLFEKIIASRIIGRKIPRTLCYPTTWQGLMDAAEEDNIRDRNIAMRRFLTGWYPSLTKTYWHNCHKGVEGGGYFGYWCFEAAGIVKAYGFPDSEFRDMPHYPQDIIIAR